MLMQHPGQFHKVAREWAIKHANAPNATDWDKAVASQDTRPIAEFPIAVSREEEERQLTLRYGITSQIC